VRLTAAFRKFAKIDCDKESRSAVQNNKAELKRRVWCAIIAAIALSLAEVPGSKMVRSLLRVFEND
jgi:hypothetical protein